MDTGLYATKVEDYGEALEAIAVEPFGSVSNAVSFLHGHCGIFALALHFAFGYPIKRIVAYDEEVEDDYLVHIYCEGCIPYCCWTGVILLFFTVCGGKICTVEAKFTDTISCVRYNATNFTPKIFALFACILRRGAFLLALV